MIALITTILDFLLCTWIFIPVIIVLPLIAYYNISSAVREDESEVFAGFVITAIVGALAYKYPEFRGFFDGWRAVATVVGGYIVAGFLLSLYKWIVVLIDFRNKSDVPTKIQSIRKILAEKDGDESRLLYRIGDAFPNCVVSEVTGGKFSVYPNWRKYSIGMWWVYWPFFLLEIPFDFVKRVIENIFSGLRHFYTGIAKKFSVIG